MLLTGGKPATSESPATATNYMGMAANLVM